MYERTALFFFSERHTSLKSSNVMADVFALESRRSASKWRLIERQENGGYGESYVRMFFNRKIDFYMYSLYVT